MITHAASRKQYYTVLLSRSFRVVFYVGATYFSGPSPAKYRGQKRA